jgi:6-pyruvoyltetrahydropterin/6-carboxytetrahydropterin synthase
VEIFKEFTFEAAHYLPNVPKPHKCGRLHGHSYRAEVRIRGEVDPERGWVMDFAEIKVAFDPIHNELDHRFLNEVAGLENPTSENVARWIWERLAGALPLAAVTVRETCTSGVTYRGGDDDVVLRESEHGGGD